MNTGEPSGMDLDGDGRTDSPEDAFGFGRYPGQYAMVLISRHPVDLATARTAGTLEIFASVPGNLRIRHAARAWLACQRCRRLLGSTRR